MTHAVVKYFVIPIALGILTYFAIFYSFDCTVVQRVDYRDLCVETNSKIGAEIGLYVGLFAALAILLSSKLRKK